MKAKSSLSRSMTVTEFEHGYWYTVELKEFAQTLGIPSAGKLRKDELEKAIICLLETGAIQRPTERRLSKSGIKDSERGLSLNLPVVNYTNNQETKDFLEREAQRIVPGSRLKPGARYRLNRWREDQLTQGIEITYADLVKEYVRLNQTDGRFALIPHGRYINFVSEFLAAEKGATREQAIKEWKRLKRMNVPKNYASWSRLGSSKDE